MPDPAFDLELVRFLSEHRTPMATAFFQFWTAVGEIEGFVVVVSFVYAAVDKRLAFRLMVLALLTMCLNHGLKTLVANPRPFVAEGSFAERWAVAPAKAEELVAEYSTPSGHAMAGASFYIYLCAWARTPLVRVAAIVTFVLLGLSRPYLGVHYVEDVVLGWALGILLALCALRFGDAVARTWNGLALRWRAATSVAVSLVVWLVTSPHYEATAHGRPLPFVSYLGFLSGIVLAYPLESRWVGFDPRSSRWLFRVLRTALAVGLVAVVLVGLDALFAPLARDASPLGDALRWVRYAAAGFAGVLVAPLLFVRLGLADTSARA